MSQHDANRQPDDRRADGSGWKRTMLLAAVAAALAAAVTAALLINIFERKQEAKNPFVRVVELDENTVDPATWGKNFPTQYDTYRKTVDQQRSRYGGSEAVPRTPSAADPRSLVAQSRLEEDPRLVTFWKGYAFSKDFREERGHAYMLLDQRLTGRQQATVQPGACVHCHASMTALYDKLGNGDPMAGFAAVNHMKYAEVTQMVQHPVACLDCHDPQTMALRVTRPAFMIGIKKVKAAQGIADFDVNRDATRLEMRAYVCGQCHVEYYFRAPDKTLTYPWDDGLQADRILSYYEKDGHRDFTHELSGAKVLKAQHPEFEMWNQGTHARAGVVCPDCHMPYRRVGAAKVSDHQVRSPLLMVNAACQTCHKASEQELLGRVHTIQDRTFRMRNRAMDAVVALIGDLQKAAAASAAGTLSGTSVTAAQLENARAWQRRAQFLLDFIEAENSMGFHADQEAMRVLGLSLDASRSGQLALRDASFGPPDNTPDPLAGSPEAAPAHSPAAAAATAATAASAGAAAGAPAPSR